MSGNSFLDAFMPTLPLWFIAFSTAVAVALITRAWVRRWNAERREIEAERHRIEHPGKVLATARDALAAVISDPLTGDSTREQALAAYDAVTGAITSNNRKSIQ